MIICLCSCGFGTDDPDWLDGHLEQYPGHYQRHMVRDIPYQRADPVVLPVRL